MKKSLKLTIVVLFMVALHAVPALAGDFDIKFGLMKKDEAGKYYVYSETTTIPLTYKDADPDFRFGYSIKTAPDLLRLTQHIFVADLQIDCEYFTYIV